MGTAGGRVRFGSRLLTGRRTTIFAIAGVLVVGLLVGGRAVLSTDSPPHPSPDHAPTAAVVDVGPGDCGTGWHDAHSGPQSFTLSDGGPVPVDVYLQDVATGKILLDAETIGSGARRGAEVSVPAGRYRFVCASTDTGSAAGPTVTVTGSYDGPLTPAVLPVTDADLVHPVVAYQDWVARRLGRLRHQVRGITTALRQHDVPAAERAWLVAHRLYHTIGAAYGAFGDFGQAIDGLPRTGIPPPADDRLTGFHKIEALLWRGKPTDVILPYATGLDAAIADLQRHFGTDLALAPIDLGLRAHEILEDALQFDLQGAADAGSHTDLATIDADIAGTRKVLAVLGPLLRGRDPELHQLGRWLDRLGRTVRSGYRHGAWTPLARLSRRQHERLNADLSQTLELLSTVAVITDPVRPMP